MKVKLIIWDLDDTLWEGTLAEGDQLQLSSFRGNLIRALNTHGIVNAICSKNDYEMAKKRLIELELWAEFVFPKISFSPKGPIVKQILDEMHLRPENTLFIDDNNMNLREVEHYVPGITTLDAFDEKTDIFLQEILEENQHVNKSRVEEYKILETKVGKSTEFSDNDDFLASCHIRISRVFGVHNLPHAERIEELINRTNQLNFTMNRVVPGSIELEIADNAMNESWAIFAWDDFGDYGLIGFAMVRKKQLIHFLFSCRTMNMGIEGHIMHMLKHKFPEIEALVDPIQAPYISLIDPESKEGDEAINRMSEIDDSEPELRIMANCQGGIISHYMDHNLTTYIEQWPTISTLQKEIHGDNPSHNGTTRFVVYGLFNDYDDRYWDAKPTSKEFKNSLELMIERLSGASLLLILPADNLESSCYSGQGGVTRERVLEFNEIARSFTTESLKYLDLGVIMTEGENKSITDVRHYPREIWQKVSQFTQDWFSTYDSV
jgi:FkbH-like protein